MPLFSYRCDNCDAPLQEVLLNAPLKEVRCPVCGSSAHRVYKPFRVIMHGIGARGRFIPGLNETVHDTGEYKRKMKAAGLMDVSLKEYESQRSLDARYKRDKVKEAKVKVKDKLMRDPRITASGVLSEIETARKRVGKA